MTDFWQGQRPWFALDNLRGPDSPDGDGARDDAARHRRQEAGIERSPRRERADEFVQRSIQRTYDR